MSTFITKYLDSIKELLPDKATQPSIGLDIGASSCKAVEVIARGDSVEILNWAIEPITVPDAASAIKKVLIKLNIQSRNISTAVSGKGTLIRYITMPRMPIEDLRNSIEIEADKHFPFAKDQIYTDCFILDQSSRDNNMQVLVAAAKKDIIDQRMRLLAGLGLKIDFIGINATAIANIFNVLKIRQQGNPQSSLSETIKEESVAILDIGHTISSLIILKNNFPYFTRDVFIGGQDLNKGIGNVLGIDINKAEQIKCQPQDKMDDVKRACESVLINLASEVRLSFDYFVTEKNVPISKLFLTGGSSRLMGIAEFFAKNLDVQVELWNPLSSFNLLTNVNGEAVKGNIQQLSVALGLALYQYD